MARGHFKQFPAQPRLRDSDDFSGGRELMAQHPFSLSVRDCNDFIHKAIGKFEHELKSTFRDDFAGLGSSGPSRPLRADPREPEGEQSTSAQGGSRTTFKRPSTSKGRGAVWRSSVPFDWLRLSLQMALETRSAERL